MNMLVDVQSFLVSQIQQQSQTLLINTLCWLDPMWSDAANLDDDWQDGDGCEHALLVVRTHFPHLYTHAVTMMHSEAADIAIGRYICSALTQEGIPVDDVEEMTGCIPMRPYGISLCSEEDDPPNLEPAILHVLECFGVDTKTPELIDVPTVAYHAAYGIGRQLWMHENPDLANIGCLLGWVFSCTGNTCIDCTYETIYEAQPLLWNTDDIAFAIEINKEAEMVLLKARFGMELLENCPDWWAALSNNVTLMYQFIVSKKGQQIHDTEYNSVELQWPTPGIRSAGAAIPDA